MPYKVPICCPDELSIERMEMAVFDLNLNLNLNLIGHNSALLIVFVRNHKIKVASILLMFYFFTPPRKHGGVIFSLHFVCVCV